MRIRRDLRDLSLRLVSEVEGNWAVCWPSENSAWRKEKLSGELPTMKWSANNSLIHWTATKTHCTAKQDTLEGTVTIFPILSLALFLTLTVKEKRKEEKFPSDYLLAQRSVLAVWQDK